MENTLKIRDDKNVKLANFLGWVIQNAGKYVIPDELIQPSRRIYADLRATHELEFHSNWNWLMLVIEKIETTEWDITGTERYERFKDKFPNIKSLEGEIILMYDNREEFKGWSFNVSVGTLPSIRIGDSLKRYETKKECAVEACLKFVDWFESNKK